MKKIILLVFIVFIIITSLSCRPNINDEFLDRANYNQSLMQIIQKMNNGYNSFIQATNDASMKKITVSQHKSVTDSYIRVIDECYVDFLKLNPPKNFENVHNLILESLKHSMNASVFLKQYLYSNNANEMTDYLTKAGYEIILANDYAKKAGDLFNKQ